MGGRFEIFGGAVEGSFTSLEAPSALCLDWRFKNWPDGVVSKVRSLPCLLACAADVIACGQLVQLTPCLLEGPWACCVASTLVNLCSRSSAVEASGGVCICLSAPSCSLI